MIRIAVPFALAPATAFAHGGHWGTLAGHDHWIALGALGLAGVVGVVAAVRASKQKDKAREEPERDEQACEKRA